MAVSAQDLELLLLQCIEYQGSWWAAKACYNKITFNLYRKLC